MTKTQIDYEWKCFDIQCEEGPATVWGAVSHGYGLHWVREGGGDSFVVTHLKSGFRVPKFTFSDHAIACLDHIVKNLPETGDMDAVEAGNILKSDPIVIGLLRRDAIIRNLGIKGV